MSGNVLTLVALKRAGPLLTGLVFAILVAGSGRAADLRLRINVTPLSQPAFERFLADRHAMPVSAEARKQLFQEFLLWRRARDRH
jgi:hypothetical protein